MTPGASHTLLRIPTQTNREVLHVGGQADIALMTYDPMLQWKVRV